ncbi:MAG: hypothetical protein NT070_22610, partial [Cyanobacteria bacterium]|nr:hypothetical protein [Cyanobacteriota bacterium]
FFSPSISIACITFCRKSELYGFGIVIAQTIRFLSILCPNLAGYSYNKISYALKIQDYRRTG